MFSSSSMTQWGSGGVKKRRHPEQGIYYHCRLVNAPGCRWCWKGEGGRTPGCPLMACNKCSGIIKAICFALDPCGSGDLLYFPVSLCFELKIGRHLHALKDIFCKLKLTIFGKIVISHTEFKS